MITLMDWLLQLEASRSSLTRIGQERLAQLAYSQQKVGKQVEAPGLQPAVRPVPQSVRCCPEAIG